MRDNAYTLKIEMFNRKNLLTCLILLLPFSVNAAHEYRVLDTFGEKGEGDAQFGKKLAISFAPDRTIYVTDTDNVRIQTFSADGTFLRHIRMDAESEFRFIAPTATIVGTDNTLYVMDWMFQPIQPSTDLAPDTPKRFTYGPCIHKFDAQGTFIATYPIPDLTPENRYPEGAVPGLDADGNYALILPQGDTKRQFLLAIDSAHTLYVCDRDTPNSAVVKLDADGRTLARFFLEQPGTGHIAHPVDMAADRHGNLYVVDEKTHRVLKYDTDGKFERSFGGQGDRYAQFIAPFRIALLSDGTLLVADTAKYLKDFASTLPRRLDNPTRYYDGPTRTFRYRLRRVQRFNTDGICTQKLLIPFQRERETDADLHLKGIDTDGTLYYLNRADLRFTRYTPTEALISSLFQTEFKLRYTRDLYDAEIDNQDDLDAGLYTASDFDEQIIADTATANLIFAYDINETYRLALSNRLTYSRMTDTSYYRAADFEDFRGRFNQDDQAVEDSWDDRVRLDFIAVRDHSLYNYREARAFLFFSLVRVDFTNRALNTSNLRTFDFTANLADWGGGLHYDLTRRFRATFEITHFDGENRYTYIDETGVLYATGAQDGGLTRAILLINGVF